MQLNRIQTTTEALQSLHRMVHNDPALQAQLFVLQDRDAFISAVQQLASDAGYVLEYDEVLQALNAGNRAWIERTLP